MRIAMDATALLGTRTGVGVFTNRLLDGLRAEGVDVQEFTVSFAARRAGEVRGRWVPLPARAASRGWRIFGGPRIERFVGDIDLVHGTNYLVPAARSPQVVSVHDLSFVRYAEHLPDTVAGFDRSVRWAVERGATVHALSHHVAAEIRDRYGAADVEVVPLGVDPRPEPPGSRGSGSGPRGFGADGPRVILALGATSRRKRIPLLVQAFAQLSVVDVEDVELHIVGPAAEDEGAVRDAIDACDPAVRSRIRRIGAVDDEARDAALAAAAVLAFPSEYEGFGLPVLEAMASGTPVVATASSSIPEVAGDAAVLVEPGDPDALANGLRALLGDETLASKLIAAGHARAASYSWSRTTTSMIALYRRVLAEADT